MLCVKLDYYWLFPPPPVDPDVPLRFEEGEQGDRDAGGASGLNAILVHVDHSLFC